MLTKYNMSLLGRFILILGLIAGQLSVMPAQRALAATLTVTNTNDSGPGSLREAIVNSYNGDTITFNSSLSGQSILLQSPLWTNKDLTVDGSSLNENIKLDGASSLDTLLGIGGPDNTNTVVTLKNLDFLNASQHGIFHSRGSLEVWNNHFSGNSLGILSFGTELSIVDSSFSNNLTGVYGFGITHVESSVFNHNQRGLVNEKEIFQFISQGEVTILDSSFIQNTQGAVNNQDGNLVIEDSVFFDNESDLGAGVKSSGDASISGSLFEGNNASQNGGAIASGGNLTINASIFSGNNANNNGGAVFS